MRPFFSFIILINSLILSSLAFSHPLSAAPENRGRDETSFSENATSINPSPALQTEVDTPMGRFTQSTFYSRSKEEYLSIIKLLREKYTNHDTLLEAQVLEGSTPFNSGALEAAEIFSKDGIEPTVTFIPASKPTKEEKWSKEKKWNLFFTLFRLAGNSAAPTYILMESANVSMVTALMIGIPSGLYSAFLQWYNKGVQVWLVNHGLTAPLKSIDSPQLGNDGNMLELYAKWLGLVVTYNSLHVALKWGLAGIPPTSAAEVMQGLFWAFIGQSAVEAANSIYTQGKRGSTNIRNLREKYQFTGDLRAAVFSILVTGIALLTFTDDPGKVSLAKNTMASFFAVGIGTSIYLKKTEIRDFIDLLRDPNTRTQTIATKLFPIYNAYKKTTNKVVQIGFGCRSLFTPH